MQTKGNSVVRRYLSAMGAAAIGSGWVLARWADQPARLVTGLRSPYAWVAEVGPDAAAVTLAASLLWLVALWTAGALSAAALSLLPGRVGLHAHAVAARLTPVLLRRVLGAAAGTSILISPNAAFANPTGSSPPAPVATSASPTSAAALSLPMDRPADRPSRGSSAEPSSQPALGWPTDPVGPPEAAHAAGSGAGPRSGDRAAPNAPKPAGPRPVPAGDHVLVRPGDSLWSIAAHRLGAAGSPARIQAEWPRWHAVNRKLIGADPNLLRPGTTLLAPRPAAPEAGE